MSDLLTFTLIRQYLLSNRRGLFTLDACKCNNGRVDPVNSWLRCLNPASLAAVIVKQLTISVEVEVASTTRSFSSLRTLLILSLFSAARDVLKVKCSLWSALCALLSALWEVLFAQWSSLLKCFSLRFSIYKDPLIFRKRKYNRITIRWYLWVLKTHLRT